MLLERSSNALTFIMTKTIKITMMVAIALTSFQCCQPLRHYIALENGGWRYEGSKEIVGRRKISNLDRGQGQIKMNVKRWIGPRDDEEFVGGAMLFATQIDSGKKFTKTYNTGRDCTMTLPAGSYEVHVNSLISREYHTQKFLQLDINDGEECELLVRIGYAEID